MHTACKCITCLTPLFSGGVGDKGDGHIAKHRHNEKTPVVGMVMTTLVTDLTAYVPF